MKSILFSFLMFTVLLSNAQSEKYLAAMTKTLVLYDSAKTTADLTAVSNTFERIADAEKTQWLPYYYAGLALSTSGWIDPKVDKDANSTHINMFCDKAEVLEKNSEIYALRNMAATQQMLVDPQTRWATYGKTATSDLEMGMKLDPNNPRLYYLKGESIFGTPAAFGGGKDKAKPVFEKAIELFKAEKPKPLYPNWGLENAEAKLKLCQ